MFGRITYLPLLETYSQSLIPAVALHVRRSSSVTAHFAGSILLDEGETAVSPHTLFDLASVTKLFTMTAFLRLVAEGAVQIDTPVVEVLPAFVGKRPIQPYEHPLQPGEWVTVSNETGPVDAGLVTFRHLLTHTSGLPAWRPLFKLPDNEREATVLDSFFSYPTGTRVVYSDLGLILLGWAVEKVAKRPLPAAIRHFVTTPLGLNSIQFGPVPPEQAAPTEFCQWRNRRMQGEVHDENAYSLGSVAGHAGLFGTAEDVAKLGQAWLDTLNDGDFLPTALAEEAILLQAEDGQVRRGLGWALWSPDQESASHLLSCSTFGHTGFTGTSLYIDPERKLVVACLTNEVFNGRSERKIGRFRRELHASVIAPAEG
ncbi:MAG: class A beta-lactamase-related serine hydrolase [Chloroflexi bacterium]|nr:MAG: class A beta-lactamase-related serine hydrolase [Chloroflexota bacterium]